MILVRKPEKIEVRKLAYDNVEELAAWTNATDWHGYNNRVGGKTCSIYLNGTSWRNGDYIVKLEDGTFTKMTEDYLDEYYNRQATPAV